VLRGNRMEAHFICINDLPMYNPDLTPDPPATVIHEPTGNGGRKRAMPEQKDHPLLSGGTIIPKDKIVPS
jgi:hypothetical protein